MASFWRRLFGRAQPAEAPPRPTAAVRDRLLIRVSGIESKLQAFLVTRQPLGTMLRKERDWSISRANVGLYRLEAPGLSVLINTEPFLSEKDGRLQGLLRMNESDLCRAIQAAQDPRDFFRRAEGLPPDSARLLEERLPGSLDGNQVLPALPELLSWESFDIQQLLSRVSPNTIAHVLIHADEGVRGLLCDNLSERKMELLLGEFESLGGVGGRSELNPHTRLRDLTHFEPALREFRTAMLSRMNELRLEERRATLAEDKNPLTLGAPGRDASDSQGGQLV